MSALVLQSDFGLDDGAVSAMYGVAVGVDPGLRIHDVTHNIPPYDIWEGSYRLAQVLSYWPEGTVFVSVVDPGVGSDRLSVVARTATTSEVVLHSRSEVRLSPVKRAPTPRASESQVQRRHCGLHSPVRVTSLTAAYTSAGGTGTTRDSWIS